jgi:hypothetical protein
MSQDINDKELLKYAAKAIGMHYWEETGYIHTDLMNWQQWDPRNDDGDALRLAVTLGINIMFSQSSVSACATKGKEYINEELKKDAYAATRRAIVRAAASIGKEMK